MKKGLIYFILIMGGILLILKFSWGILSDVYKQGNNFYIKQIEDEKQINLSSFIKKYKEKDFTKIELINDKILKGYSFIGTGKAINSIGLKGRIIPLLYKIYITNKPLGTSLKDLGINLSGNSVIEVKYKDEGLIEKLIINIIPVILIFLFLMFILKGALPKGGGLGLMNGIGKQAKPQKIKTKFSDVAGMKEVKEEVKEIVDFLKKPEKYIKAGAEIPKGVLLYGAPGSGKTLLARAIAGEAKVPFFYSSGSEFMEMLVGMGAAKVRELFKKAKSTGGPAIIFIDEIDAIGKKRGQGITGGHQEQEQTLNQILTEMDGFEKDHKIIVIAATNRIDVLDPALLRPGRFDRKIFVNKPTLEERKEIFMVYLKNKKIDKNLDLNKLIDSLAIRTIGFVGADISNLVNEAALHAAKNDRDYLTQEDFEYSLEKIIAGPEKKIKSITEEEREKIAYHELGHAITAHILPYADQLEKISIVSRGMALGLTWIMPTKDSVLTSKNKLLDDITSLLGGRVAEEIFFGKDEITTGASNDMSRVYKIVYDMVTKYGMSDLGPIMYFDETENNWKMYKPYSEKLAEKIDNEIEKIIKHAYERAKKIINDYQDIIHILSKELLKKEYMTKEEFVKIVGFDNITPENNRKNY